MGISTVISFKVLLTNAAPFKAKSAFPFSKFCWTNSTALFLSGQGTIDLRTDGNSFKNDATTPTGDVLLSTKNFAKGDNYSLIVEFR